MQRDFGNLATDRQALRSDGQELAAIGSSSVPIGRSIRADLASGNSSKLQQDLQQFQQDRQTLGTERAKTESDLQEFGTDRHALRHDERDLREDLSGGQAQTSQSTGSAAH